MWRPSKATSGLSASPTPSSGFAYSLVRVVNLIRVISFAYSRVRVVSLVRVVRFVYYLVKVVGFIGLKNILIKIL